MSEFLSSTREQFAEELERLLRKADERRPVALIVSGEPGLGKSTTLETVRQRWERGEGTSVPVLDPEDIGTLSTVLDPGGGTPTLLVVDDIDQWAAADTHRSVTPELIAVLDPISRMSVSPHAGQVF